MKLFWTIFIGALALTAAQKEEKPIMSNVATFELEWPKLYTAIVAAPGTFTDDPNKTHFVADIDFLSVKESNLPSPYDDSGTDFIKISFMVHTEIELKHLQKLAITSPKKQLNSASDAYDPSHAFFLEVDTFLTSKFQDELKPSPDNMNFGTFNQNFDTISGFPCYKNVAGSFAWMDSMVERASSIPNLSIEIEDIGDSYLKSQNPNNGYDIKVLRVTGNGVENEGRTTEKGILFMMTGLHARELAPTELLSRWVESMVDGYGNDADKTSILDHTVIHFVMQANPDGRNDAELNVGNYRRKNMNPSGSSGCSNSASTGVDLNRNWPFKWGFGNGSSNNKCDQTYRGLSPASEPEVSAIVDYCLRIFPEDQRKDNPEQDKQIPFVDTNRGIFMDTHSYSEIIIWPWGHEELATGNDSQMEALVAKFRHFNDYGFSGPGNGFLYAASGVSDDWAYGVLGVPAFTFELGTTFYQSCSYFEDDILPKNLPSLTYAAKSSTMPYRIPKGPDVTNLSTSVNGNSLTVTVTASDSAYSSNNHESSRQGVREVRAFVNIHPYDEENGQTPVGSVLTNGQSITIDITNLDYGKHTVYIQAEDGDGFFGPVTAAYFIKNDPNNPLPTSSPTTPPPVPLPCTDNPEGWHDSDGPQYDCDWYSQGTNCAQYGDSYENFGKTANEACCACGGGLVGTPAPVATPAPITTPAPVVATPAPTRAPTRAPTSAPTRAPTRTPTSAPTRSPTKNPTQSPVNSPTNNPTIRPPSTSPPVNAPSSPPVNNPPPVDAPVESPEEGPVFSPTVDEEDWDEISTNDFEDKDVGDFVPNTVRKIKNNIAYGDSEYSVRLKKKNKVQTIKFDIRPYSVLKVEFVYYPKNTETNDYFQFQMKFNGEGWKTKKEFKNLVNNEWESVSLEIDDEIGDFAAANDRKNNVRFRFFSQQDQGNDQIYIDNVNVYGME